MLKAILPKGILSIKVKKVHVLLRFSPSKYLPVPDPALCLIAAKLPSLSPLSGSETAGEITKTESEKKLKILELSPKQEVKLFWEDKKREFPSLWVFL